MKKIVLFLFAFCMASSITKLSAQCEPPSILWDEDGILLNWIAKDNATGHIVRYRETGTFVFTNVDIGKESYFDITFLDKCVEYDFVVRTKCGDDESSSTPIHKVAINCGSCYKEYCEVPNKGEFGLVMNYFRFDDVINESEIEGQGYEDFRGDFDRVAIPDQEVEVEVRFNENNFFQARVDIYIDYNRNQEFEVDETVISSVIQPNTPFISSFTVPSIENLDFGLSRMRVIVSPTYNEVSPCVTTTFSQSGEVEEYCIVIGQLLSECDFNFNTELVNITDDGAEFEWSELSAAQGYNYRFKKTSEDDSQWEEFATIDNTASLSELDQCEEYEFEIRGVCPFDTSGYKNNIVFNSFCPTSVEDLELTIQNITSYPNPWSENINIAIEANESINIDIYAHNLNGEKILLLEDSNINIGNNLISINNLNHLSSGVYFLEIIDENNRSKFHKTLKIQ